MDLFKWENGTIKTPAKVLIDGVEYEVIPEEVEGNTPLSADNLNEAQDKIVSYIGNVELVAVTDTAPATCNIGDKYYNTTSNLIFTATDTDTWGSTGKHPKTKILYLVLPTQKTFCYDGSALISVGGGGGSVHIQNEAPQNPEEDDLWIDEDDGFIAQTTGMITAKITENQECPNSSVTTLTLNSAVNIGEDFSLENGAVKCNRHGFVEISALFAMNNLVNNGNTQLRIYKNDSIITSLNTRVYASGIQGFSISPMLIEVNEGDALSLRVGNWSQSSNTATNSDENTCSLTAKYVIASSEFIKDVNIKNERTESETDVYSCDYINEKFAISLEEKKVGTWIDGKPLYKKTIQIDAGTETNVNFLHGIENVETIWINQGESFFINKSDKNYYITAGHYGGANDWSRFYVTNVRIHYQFGTVYATLNKIIYLTLCYTKTTD